MEKRLKGKPGKHRVDAASETKEEFADRLQRIWDKLHDPAYGWDFDKWGPPILCYDNPSFHKLSPELLQACNIGTSSVMRPPRYSGDFMQCIEHVHGYVCQAFQRKMYVHGLREYDFEKHSELLEDTFFATVTPKAVAANCEKLQVLVKHVLDTKTGDYAPPRLT